MGTKQQVIEDLFKYCKAKGNWEFGNELVKRYSQKNGFGNPFDVTKVDNSSVLPQMLRNIEIDLTLEQHGVITVVEGKNGFPEDFAVYQIFHPFKYYAMLRGENRLSVRQISTCYVLRRQEQGRSILRLYNYTFEDENELESIRLLKKAQYNLIKR